MMKPATGLVLEGGGMRGVYTAGILEFFLQKELHFPYVIGVSAGACNGISYISKQKGRNKRVNIEFIRDPRYLSYRNLWKEKSMFGMDFIFDEVPNGLVPFDYDAFQKSNQTFIVGTTDCLTGKPVYYNNHEEEDLLTVLRASSSLPFVSQPVKIRDKILMDGGISDPIPLRKSLKDGNSKHVIVLTRNKDYRKKPAKGRWFAKRFYPQYEGLVNAMFERDRIYNETLDQVEELEAEGRAFVFRPSVEVTVKRMEKDPKKLEDLYEVGFNDAQKSYDSFITWLNSEMDPCNPS